MMTHDYKRHGTTTLDVKSGKVIGDCMPRHPLPGSGLPANHERGAKEFLKFLRQIDKADCGAGGRGRRLGPRRADVAGA